VKSTSDIFNDVVPLGRLIHMVNQKKDRLLNDYLSPLDITATQFKVLCSIRCEVCITPVELKKVLSVDLGALTRMLDRLVCKGWIERSPNPNDKRGVLVKLTSDGAAIALVMSDTKAKALGLTPKARFVSFATGGVPPEIMGIGPVVAIPKALAMAGLKLDHIGLIELNEAFAAQALAVIGDLGLDPSKVNPMGGAIALGHPLGATGAIRAATTIHALRRKNLKYGMVTMCVGTGMGAAGIFERV
jgi:acetyl-CoA acetyltransferase